MNNFGIGKFFISLISEPAIKLLASTFLKQTCAGHRQKNKKHIAIKEVDEMMHPLAIMVQLSS